MSRERDYRSEMSSVDALLRGFVASALADPRGDAVLAEFLDELAGLATTTAPEPSAELAALLAGTPGAATGGRRHSLRRALAAAACTALLTTLALSHQVPDPAQRMVSTVIHKLDPFGTAPRHAVRTHPTVAPTAPVHRPSRPSTPGRPVTNAKDRDPRLGPQPVRPRPALVATQGRDATAPVQRAGRAHAHARSPRHGIAFDVSADRGH